MRSPTAALILAGAVVACGQPDDPQLVAIQYVRAINTGDPDTAIDLLDLEEVLRRVEEQIVVVQHADAESFLRASVETLLWGLFRETPQSEYGYDAPPAELDGDEATVVVSKLNAGGEQSETVVDLRLTASGWRVSGDTLNPLVSYLIQRLEERY